MRWMEKQEAHSLRRALEHMDIADETRLHKAAQDEASELVWKHQNPDAPYRYKEHLRKGSYSRSHSLGGGSTRSVSGSSNGSQPDNREPCDSSVTTRADASPQHEKDSEETKVEDPVERNAKIKFAESIFNSGRRRSSGSGKRKPSGSNVAAIFSNPDDKIYEETEPISPKKSMDPAPIKPSPIPTRRNPFARVQFARANSTPTRTSATPSPETKKFDKFEIQRNPPSQSRNPLYTANDLMPPFNPTPKLDPPDEEVKMKDGKEIRGDDIRAATSMKFADRSTKLPTPVLVSDSPGRPIVSFKEPKQIELKEEISHEPQPPASLRIEKKPSLPTVPSVSQPPSNNVQGPSALSASIRPAALVQARSAPAIPTTPSAFAHTANPSRRRSKPSLELKSTPPIPMINFPDSPTVPDIQISAPSVPSIAINDAPSIPTINVEPARPIPSISVDSAPAPPLPTINVSSAPPIPSISINSAPPPIPTISIGDTPPAPPSITTPGVSITPSMPPTPPPNRPLPTPTRKSASGPPNRPSNAHTKPHWSPAPPSSMSSHARATALCSSCALPIAGRIVSAAGARFHPECFRCHHCAEALECVAFYPEPDAARSERTSRIRLRQTTNQPVKASVSPASSEEEDRRLEEQDGYDENDARFYCHLDFHEFFSPRCKSCKTPIEGEVVLACGTTWHSGKSFPSPFPPIFAQTTSLRSLHLPLYSQSQL